MPKPYLIFLPLLLLLNSKIYCQEIDDDFLNMEFEIGLGYSKSSSRNIFNDHQGIAPKGGLGVNMAFRYHMNYNWSAGIHILLNLDEIHDYDPDLVLGFQSESLISMSNVNLGFNGKYTFNLNRWQPYLWGGLGIALGGMSILEYEDPVNQFTGIDLNMGIGLGYMVTYSSMVSMSFLRNNGVAWWKYYPSADSINKQFNPAFWSFTVNVSFFFGDENF